MQYRSNFDTLIPDKNARILEIGPLNRPLVSKDLYPNAVYCDVRSTDEVKKLYTHNDYLNTTNISVPIDEIVDIDYVLKGSYSLTFQYIAKFDYIIASHVLEHVEDLIGVLVDIMSILTPQGKFIVFYPDKRYCFDHFRSEASFRDAYDVHIHQRPALARMVLDFFYSALPENDAYIFWQAKNIEELLPSNSIKRALSLYEQSKSGQFMDDVHYWPFSDAGFVRFLYDCVRADLLRISCADFFPTQENTQEFLIIMQNGNEEWNRDEALRQLRLHYSKVASSYNNSQQLEWRNLQATVNELQRLNHILQNECSTHITAVRQLSEEKNQLVRNFDELQRLNQTLQNECSTHIAAAHQLSEEKKQLVRNFDELQRLNQSLQDECAVHTSNIRQLSDENTKLKRIEMQLADTRTRLADKEKQLEDRVNQLATEHAKLEQCNSNLAALDIRIEALEHSTSWKITKPLRAIGRFIHKQK